MEKNLNEILEKFFGVLNKLEANLAELLELENEKYEELKSVNIQGIMKLNTAEEELIAYSESLEKERRKMIMELSKELGFEENLKLSEMQSYFPLAWQEKISGVRSQIQDTSKQLDTTMRENAKMIRANLDIVNFTLSFAKGESKEGYDRGGEEIKDETKPKLRMIDHFA